MGLIWQHFGVKTSFRHLLTARQGKKKAIKSPLFPFFPRHNIFLFCHCGWFIPTCWRATESFQTAAGGIPTVWESGSVAPGNGFLFTSISSDNYGIQTVLNMSQSVSRPRGAPWSTFQNHTHTHTHGFCPLFDFHSSFPLVCCSRRECDVIQAKICPWSWMECTIWWKVKIM